MIKIRELTFKIFNKLNSKAMVRALFISLIAIIAFLIALNFTSALGLLDLKYKNIIVSFGLMVSLVPVVLLFLLFNSIMNSVNYITQYAKMLSDGKLNTSDIVIKSSNDFSMLARAINNLKSNLLFLLDQTKANILVLSDSIENVSVNMDTFFGENEQVSSEMQEIASKSQEQLNIVTDTIAKTDEVKGSVDTITINIKEVEVIASDANSAVATGKESLNIYNENINLISQSIADTYEFITGLKLRVSEIGSVVSFIVGLSKQLKLLSLNASIQAGRSGEAGRGFIVVAQEITKLSDSTKEGVDKINTIITNVLEGSNNVEDSIKKSIKYFESGKRVFSNVEKVFNEISKKNIVLLNQINGIDSEASKINSNIKNTVMLCKKVNDSSVVVSQSTEEVVSSIEQELGELQKINSLMSRLHSELTKIESLVTRFELDIKPEAENPQKPLKIAIMVPSVDGIWDIIRFGALYGKKVLKSKNTMIEIIPISIYSQDEYLDDNALKDCIKKGYDGIVTPGFFQEKLQDAIKINIPVVTFNTDTKEKNKRIAYVGENSYQSGVVAGKTMIEQIDGKGKLLIITSDTQYEHLKLRKQGLENVILKNKNMEIVDILEVPFGDEKIYKIVKEYLNKNTDISGVFCITAGVLGLARAIEESDMSSNLKTIVFYDNTEKIIEHINKGTITCTIGQDPFRQGYDSLIYLYNYLVTGEKPDGKKTWTKVEIMDINKAKNFLG